MKTPNDGEPAFPVPVGEREFWDREENGNPNGITIRDYFAAAAMQGILAADVHEGAFEYVDRKEPHSEWVPPTAYAIADAMLAARKEGA
jgi:hypothetical protein